MTATADASKRDALTRIFDVARVNGAAYLFVIALLGQMTVQSLSDLTGDSDVTIQKYLARMESRHLIVRVRVGKADHWHLSPRIEPLLLLPKFLVTISSSSDPDLSSDPEEEIRSEEEGGDLPKNLAATDAETLRERNIKTYLADTHYHLTGEYRAAYLDDDWITAIDFEMWLHQIDQMKREGVRIKFPAAYALSCLQKQHLADPRWEHSAQRDLADKLRYFDEENEVTP